MRPTSASRSVEFDVCIAVIRSLGIRWARVAVYLELEIYELRHGAQEDEHDEDGRSDGQECPAFAQAASQRSEANRPVDPPQPVDRDHAPEHAENDEISVFVEA